MAHYNRYSKNDDHIILDLTRDFNPREYLEKAAELRLLMQEAAKKLPDRDIHGLRKRYLRLHGVTVIKRKILHRTPRPLPDTTPAPIASPLPSKPVQLAKTEPITEDWHISPPTRERLMGRR